MLSARAGLGLTVLAMAVGSPGATLAQVGRNQGAIDPNVATEAQLMSLPAFGAALAQALMQQRPFLSMLELDAFLDGKSVAREQRVELYRRMFIHINLNAATREEILLVPGVGPRMAREFLEYRPYDGLPRFRREIGKYVDSTEVARLEQYVFIPLDLNAATDEEILAIPGVGRRMLREFREYRPYSGMEQFRREIGKYVNAREVARLERYVRIK